MNTEKVCIFASVNLKRTNMMSKKTLLSACLGGVLGLMSSCGANAQMPKGELTSLSYTRSGMMAGYEYEGRVEKTDSGIIVKAMRESYGPSYQLTIDQKTLDKFRAIIEEEKMYEYKNRYEPAVRVLDGYMWSFFANFSDDQYISSGGSNAGPDGNGLGRIWKLFIELANDPKAVMIDKEREW